MTKQTSQAIRIHQYGGPEILKLESVQSGEPQAGEVLVRVLAAGVNPVDWKITEGYVKNFMPVQFPYIPGRDIAGIVEEVGPGVTEFQQGQAVFGQTAQGGYAEYTVASINKLALKPERITFEEAATIPVGATTAWQGLFENADLQAGQTILVQGAAGGVGLFVVQFAHRKGAHVIATTSTANVDFVRSLGAEKVIDYKTTSVEQVVHDVDFVFDTVGEATLASSVQVLKQNGTLVSIAGQPPEQKVRERNIHVVSFMAQVSTALLQTFARFIDDGQVKAAVEKTFLLSAADHAVIHSQSGHSRGRVVLQVAH